jgi:putative heme uptake system protein
VVPDAVRPPAYLLIDGENIDTTLGQAILGRRPTPDERPRWERLVGFVGQRWGADVTALFFIHAHGEHLPMPFIQALTAMGYRPIPLTGPADVKVVDVAITRTLDAIAARDGDVALASHDGDFLVPMSALVAQGRRTAVIGFREFMNAGWADLADRGLELLDMERDAGVFTYRLPRLRIIPIEEFDPVDFL